MPNQSALLDSTFHALADSTRRAVLARLSQGTASVKELAEPFEMALPSFLQHLKVLEESGLIRSHKVGRVRTCAANHDQLSTVESWLATQRMVWEKRLDQLDSYLMELKERHVDDTGL
jgi:DNA-binding transcriptional ArsR family regulator